MISVYDYLDYREFLKDFYKSAKSDSFYHSYRYLARRTGIDASNLAKIIMGKRHIPANCIDKVGKTCNLNERELLYFSRLVRFNIARSERRRQEAYMELLAVKYVPANIVRRDRYEFYQKWYYTAIRALIGAHGFDGKQYAQLAKQLQPPLSVKQARDAVKLLERLKFIRKSIDGSYHITERNISTGDAWESLAIREYQHDCIRLSAQSLSLHDKKDRDVSTVTMAVPKSCLSQVRDILQTCRKSIISLVNEQSNADAVYQLNMQFFPVADCREQK